MRIDIGTEGKVLATKRVNEDGHVAGLKRHAGQDVLVVVPSRTPRYQVTLADRTVAARDFIASRAKKALALEAKYVPKSVSTQVKDLGQGAQDAVRRARAEGQRRREAAARRIAEARQMLSKQATQAQRALRRPLGVLGIDPVS